MTQPMTGMDLRVERVRRDLTLTQVARYLGLSRVTVLKYERQESPRPEVVARYREALLALRRGA